ncbi:MAG TPA: hypothetical protein VFE14_06355, partial [Micromonosporaceae bacterium]|nr:hypothetical protein [Micromonosporaceae bacterium]
MMASSVAIVSGGLAGLAVAGGAAAAGTAWLRRSPPYTRGSHAEHDPHRRDPLAAALRRGFASLGVTTYLGPDGDLRLERDGDRTLRDLILRPLAARVTAGAGRVYPGHEEPLWLLVELPADDPARAARGYQVLETQLREYAWMLTGWRDDELHPGAVTVVLTGADCPRHLLAAQPDRLAFADGTFADVDSWAAPAGLVPLVSEHWA